MGTLIHLIDSADGLSLLFTVLFMGYFVLLTFIFKKWSEDEKKKKIWKVLCFGPLLFSLIHCIIQVCGWAFKSLFSQYLHLYILAILIALTPFFVVKKSLFRLDIILIIFVWFCSAVMCFFSNRNTNYSKKSWSKAYLALCDHFEKSYIMNDWKKINYDKLREEGLAKVKEAEKKNDVNLYYEALQDFVYEFHDGHMEVSVDDKNYYSERLKEYNDYGLSLVKLDDGTTIAVDVDGTLPMKEGSIITKWNGVPVYEAIQDVKLPFNEATVDNEEIMKTFYLAGSGEGDAEVSYINSNYNEVNTVLYDINGALPRIVTSVRQLNHRNSKEDKDFDYKMLNNHIGYMKIGSEKIDFMSDNIGYVTGNHKKAREKYRTCLQKLRDEGMTKLVIDIRNNEGGYDEVATALASLFTKEDMYAYSLGIRWGDGYKSVQDRYVIGDGEFSDIDVVLLTNMECGSAGDGMVLYLSRIENVTVAGLSNPGGYNQETGGHVYMPEGAVIDYPIGVVLDENGNPNIDVDYTRESRDPLDVKIPLDKEAAAKIFNGIDYEVDWAIHYLDENE